MRKNGMLFLCVIVLAVLTSACTFAGKEAVQDEPEKEVVSEREEAAAQEEEQVEENRDFIDD